MEKNANSIEAKLEYDPKNNTLNGKPFVGTEVQLGPDKSRPRECGYCFYHEDDGRIYKDCHLGSNSNSAHKFFGIPTNQILPKRIESQGRTIQTGNYCPSFVDFTAD